MATMRSLTAATVLLASIFNLSGNIGSRNSSLPSLLFADAVPSPSPFLERQQKEQKEERERRRKSRERRARERERAEKPQKKTSERARAEKPQKKNSSSNENDSSGDPLGGTTISFETLFVTRRPRDAVDGFTSGLSNAVRGTFYGVVTLFAAPFAGLAAKKNVVGFLAGAICGVVLGVALPLAGAVVGLYQAVAGLIATPAAVRDGFVNCRVWDEEERVWVEYRLDEDAADLKDDMKEEAKRLEEAEGENKRRRRDGEDGTGGRRKVKSSGHYDLLGVATDSTTSNIRSAYRKMARSVHPDKNPDDPEAERKFRELSAAYQTLSNPEQRRKYDASGVGISPENVGEGMNPAMLDPYVFFAVLFGSDRVEPYVGELGMAATFDALLKLGRGKGESKFSSFAEAKEAFGWTENALKKRKRQINIATHLRTRVEDYVDGLLVAEAFGESCRSEALKIAKSESYGATFLLAIGPALIAESDAFLGYRSSSLQGVWRGPLSGVKRRLHFLRRRWSMTKSILRTVKSGIMALYDSAVTVVDQNEGDSPYMRDEEREQKKTRQLDNDLLKNNLENTIPTILEMAWAMNFLDISNTLSGACDKLFHDADVPSWEDRLRRAEAVHILGREFYSVGMEAFGGNVTFTGNTDDIKARATEAFMESLKKGMQNGDQRSSSDEM